jgi:hypothetical protein
MARKTASRMMANWRGSDTIAATLPCGRPTLISINTGWVELWTLHAIQWRFLLGKSHEKP